jgi:CRP/FNR family transcriptional regulator, cyclic AMP receptor protein
MDHKLAMLAKVPLFSGLNEKQLTEVGRLTDEVDLPAGHVLMREGGSGNEFYVIVSGSVDVTRGGQSIRTLGPGDFLGEIALIDRGPRSATATATSAVSAQVLGVREFHSLLDAHPGISKAVLATLAQRVRHLEPDAH